MAIRRVIATCDLFIASRFHALIAALTEGVPTLVCGWGHKYLEVLGRFGLREHALDYRELSIEPVWHKFQTLAQAGSQVRQQIEDELSAVRAEAYRQIAFCRGLAR
jgi:polysaccharide pyruvyl transferase WcaK-like protein